MRGWPCCRARRSASTVRGICGSRTPTPRPTSARRSTAWRPSSRGSRPDGAAVVPTVADLLIQGVRETGTRRLFVAPGGGSAAALLQSAEAQGLPFTHAHSEFAACVMAAVSGELTGAPGVAVTGRGAMAAAPGVEHARRDRAPMIVLTDDEPAASPAFTGESSFDVSTLYDVLAKQSLRVTADSAFRCIAHAAQLSMQEPRGPVHLGLARDVAGETALPVATTPRSVRLAPPDSAALDAAAA